MAMKNKTWKKVGYVLFCIGVPAFIYWSIIVDPIIGHDEEGEPVKGLAIFAFSAMMIGCYVLLVCLEERREMKLLIYQFETMLNNINGNEDPWLSNSIVEHVEDAAVDLYRKYIPLDAQDENSLAKVLERIDHEINNSVNATKLLDVKGQILMMMGEYESARDLYKKILDKNPDYINAYLQIIRSYQTAEIGLY